MAKAKKSARIKLSPAKLQDLRDAIISGEAPKSIHERLGVTIHNIHYHKGELKKKGLLKTGTVKKTVTAKKSVSKPVPSVKSVKHTAKTSPEKHTLAPKAFKLIVNGVSVHIEGAGSVSVGEGFIKVDY